MVFYTKQNTYFTFLQRYMTTGRKVHDTLLSCGASLPSSLPVGGNSRPFCGMWGVRRRWRGEDWLKTSYMGQNSSSVPARSFLAASVFSRMARLTLLLAGLDVFFVRLSTSIGIIIPGRLFALILDERPMLWKIDCMTLCFRPWFMPLRTRLMW